MSTTTNVVEYPDMGFVSTCGYVQNTFSHNVANKMNKMPATHKSNYYVTHSAVWLCWGCQTCHSRDFYV
jgi:hypothetical protein